MRTDVRAVCLCCALAAAPTLGLGLPPQQQQRAAVLLVSAAAARETMRAPTARTMR
jgi:hypothetical protein